MTILWYWAAATSLVWVGMYVHSARRAARLERTSDWDIPARTEWPGVSVIVPARNEVGQVESALRSLLELDYPNLEIVAVDDRSDDGTGEIIDRLADEDDRLKAVHIDRLPDRWLGKTHALHRGFERAGGRWILLADADVHFDPEALKATVAVAEADDLDQLTMMPEIETGGFGQEVAYAGFLTGVTASVDFDALEDPESDVFAGIGAFNLVRRKVLEAAGGFEELRMEVADDFGVGKLAVRHGGRGRAALDDRYLRLAWYPSLGGMVQGMEKNLFAALGHYSYARVAGIVVAMVAVSFGPVVGLMTGHATLVGLVGAAGVASVLFSLYAARRFRRGRAAFLLHPVGSWILIYTLVRSAYLCWRRGGIEWRDTRYPLDELRDGQIVQL